jgi:hypothetical protein
MFVVTHTAGAQTMPADDGVVQVSLERGETRDDSELPYRRANLTVRYASPASGTRGKHGVIRGITVRSARGGPTMLFGVTIPPDSPPRALRVVLPALSAEDSYNVRLLAGETADAAVIAEFDLSLDWPAGWVTAQAFLDPEAYETGDYLPPVWSHRTLQSVFVISAVACVLLAASLLVRHAGWRVSAAMVTVIAAAAGLYLVASSEPTVVRQEIGDDGRLLMVSCLRDGHCEISGPHTVPLYYDLEEMARDEAVIRTSEKLNVYLKSGKVRLFARPADAGRRAKTQPATMKSAL